MSESLSYASETESDSQRYRNEVDVERLTGLLASEDPKQRQKARRALVMTGKPAVEALIHALSDVRAHVRWEAAKALCCLRDIAAASMLVALLEDSDGDVRWVAAEALISLERKAVEPLLAALALRSQSYWLCRGARHILRHLARKRSCRIVQPVLDALKQPEPGVAVPLAAYATLCALRSPYPTVQSGGPSR